MYSPVRLRREERNDVFYRQNSSISRTILGPLVPDDAAAFDVGAAWHGLFVGDFEGQLGEMICAGDSVY